MIVEKQDNGNIVFTDEKGSYTFLDMGCYVGYNTRQWYEEEPSCWRLMFYDENKEESPIHIEALVDTTGYYSRLIVKQDNYKRVMQLHRDTVLEDVIYEENPNSLFDIRKTYVAFEDKYREKNHSGLLAYLSQEQQFLASDGEAYSGVISSNGYILDFFKANAELSKSIDEVNLSNTK